jgi:hypothetical protein
MLNPVPWGVLGTQLMGNPWESSKDIQIKAPKPDETMAVVDPAGLPYIQDKGPGAASGASGTIYSWIGLSNKNAFPEDVRKHVTHECTARLHKYDAGNVIHSIGPDLRQAKWTKTTTGHRARVVEALAQAYQHILAEFATSTLKRLRLLPVSGGIFSGTYSPDMPRITVEALQKGFSLLDDGAQARVIEAEVLELCIFLEREFKAYSQAVNEARTGTPKVSYESKPRQNVSEEASVGVETVPAGDDADPRLKYSASSDVCWRKKWTTLKQKHVGYYQSNRDQHFEEMLPRMTEDLSQFVIERFTGKRCKEWQPAKLSQICVGNLEARLKVDEEVRKECVHAGWHGVPIPLLQALIDAGEATPWPGVGRDPNDLGRSWWSNSLNLALSCGGPVEIGEGWMVSCAVATEASEYLGPNQHQRTNQYGSKRVIPTGAIYVQSLHIAQLVSGEGRFLPVWKEFPWTDFRQWQRTKTLMEQAVQETKQQNDSEDDDPERAVKAWTDREENFKLLLRPKMGERDATAAGRGATRPTSHPD